MEKINNGCILLKQKEYDELIEKSKKNESKEIKLSWIYDFRSNYRYPIFHAYGDILLSDKIQNQIQSIVNNIEAKLKSCINEINKTQECRDRLVFSELSLYKRVFFKP